MSEWQYGKGKSETMNVKREDEKMNTHHQINQLLKKKEKKNQRLSSFSHTLCMCAHYVEEIMALKSSFIVARKKNRTSY